MKSRHNIQQITADYYAAFEGEHGHKPPMLMYQGGWFHFAGRRSQKYRRIDIQRMTETLRARSNDDGTKTPLSPETKP